MKNHEETPANDCRDNGPGDTLPGRERPEPTHPLHEEAEPAEPLRGSLAPLFLAAFFIGALAGAYLHNWAITIGFSVLSVFGYIIETAPTMEDDE